MGECSNSLHNFFPYVLIFGPWFYLFPTIISQFFRVHSFLLRVDFNLVSLRIFCRKCTVQTLIQANRTPLFLASFFDHLCLLKGVKFDPLALFLWRSKFSSGSRQASIYGWIPVQWMTYLRIFSLFRLIWCLVYHVKYSDVFLGLCLRRLNRSSKLSFRSFSEYRPFLPPKTVYSLIPLSLFGDLNWSIWGHSWKHSWMD